MSQEFKSEDNSLMFIIRDLNNNLKLLRRCYKALVMKGRKEGYDKIPSESLVYQIMNLVDNIDEEIIMLKDIDEFPSDERILEMVEEINKLRNCREIKELESMYK